jgi:hypothetical protein
MAFVASQDGVLTQEWPTCLAMVKPSWRGGPVDQLVLPAVVLGVAAGTILIRGGSAAANNLRVIAPLFGKPAADFVVAFQAFELDSPSAESVAGGALERAVEVGVSLRQRAWRHLGTSAGQRIQHQQRYPDCPIRQHPEKISNPRIQRHLFDMTPLVSKETVELLNINSTNGPQDLSLSSGLVTSAPSAYSNSSRLPTDSRRGCGSSSSERQSDRLPDCRSELPH